MNMLKIRGLSYWFLNNFDFIWPQWLCNINHNFLVTLAYFFCRQIPLLVLLMDLHCLKSTSMKMEKVCFPTLCLLSGSSNAHSGIWDSFAYLYGFFSKAAKNRTFASVLSLENKIHPSLSEKQWHFQPEPWSGEGWK